VLEIYDRLVGRTDLRLVENTIEHHLFSCCHLPLSA
jgi:hypothetical protein